MAQQNDAIRNESKIKCDLPITDWQVLYIYTKLCFEQCYIHIVPASYSMLVFLKKNKNKKTKVVYLITGNLVTVIYLERV